MSFREKLKNITDEQLIYELISRYQVGTHYQRGENIVVEINGMDMPEQGKIQSNRDAQFIFEVKTGKLLYINII